MRTIKMTLRASRNLSSQLSNGKVFCPTQFEIEGNSKGGYDIMYLDDNRCGFHLLKNEWSIRTMKEAKELIKGINEGTITDNYSGRFSVGCFAWKVIDPCGHKAAIDQANERMPDAIRNVMNP